MNNVQSATQLLAQTTLRNILGTKSLHDILAEREVIAVSMGAQLDEGTESWGIKVERVEMYVVVFLDLSKIFFSFCFSVRMFVYLNQCNDQWLRKLKQVVKLVLK